MEKGAWAIIFTSRLRDGEGYGTMADRMEELARAQPGYLGHDSVRGADGIGITVSYWSSQEAVNHHVATLLCLSAHLLHSKPICNCLFQEC